MSISGKGYKEFRQTWSEHLLLQQLHMAQKAAKDQKKFPTRIFSFVVYLAIALQWTS